MAKMKQSLTFMVMKCMPYSLDIMNIKTLFINHIYFW